jgi:hypothetical protein
MRWHSLWMPTIPNPPALSAEVDDALEESIALRNWLQEHQAQTCEHPSLRTSTAIALFGLCLEHREAIILLLSFGARSSAYALVRAMFEAYMRGMWALHLASEEQLKAFWEQKYDPKVETIVKQLDKKFSAGVFAHVKASGWETLCDYAHAGGRQLSRWLVGDSIAPAHPDDEVPEILHFVDYYAVLALLGMNSAAGVDVAPIINKAEELTSGWKAASGKAPGAVTLESLGR